MRRSLSFVDRLVVAVAINSAKQPLFSVEERMRFIRESVKDDPRIEVREFTGLLVDFARAVGATLSIRGLRAVADFEYEYQMALMNRHLHEQLETVFMVPSIDLTFVSSSIVREVARYGGETSGLVHPVVSAALRERFARP
jgi:pantetheine-phosphate adenylyltransferase